MLRLIVLATLLHGAIAHAEDLATYEAEGDASTSAGDPRVEALDDAFARAAAQALEDVLPADVRAAHKKDLDREIIGHARLWVAKFTVTKDTTGDQRRQLTVAVRVDRDKMRARLTELALAPTTPEPPKARSATILLRIADPSGVRADYGPDAAKDLPGLTVAAGALRGAGMTVKRAPASGATAAPLDDDSADALAAEAKADLIAIANVSVGAPVNVRGAPLALALVEARVRLVERKGHQIRGEGVAVVAAGADVPASIDRAIAAAFSDVLPAASHALDKADGFHGDDVPLADAGLVLVRLPPKTPYALVLAEQKHLAGGKGVSRATLRRVGPGGWVIGVATSEPADRIAAMARKPPATDTQAAAKLVGDIVELTLTGTAP